MTIPDNEQLNIVSLTKAKNTLHNIIRLFRLTIHWDIPSFADFFSGTMRTMVRYLQQRRMVADPIPIRRFFVRCPSLMRNAAGSINHTRFHRMEEIHLPSTPAHQISREINHRASVARKIRSCQNFEHARILSSSRVRKQDFSHPAGITNSRLSKRPGTSLSLKTKQSNRVLECTEKRKA